MDEGDRSCREHAIDDSTDGGGRSRREHAIESNSGAIAECVSLAVKGTHSVPYLKPEFGIRNPERTERDGAESHITPLRKNRKPVPT
jgi:hypothetical protein